MWKNTEVSHLLKISVPIIQGPLGGGASSVDLVTAVSESGGLGSYGANHLSGKQIREITKEIRAKTKKPFALNLWVPFEDSENPPITDEEFTRHLKLFKPYFDELRLELPKRPKRFSPSFYEQIDALLAVCPAVFSFVFGIPSSDILHRCRELNIVTIGTATTPAEAIALDHARVDLIVATGFEAGGHRVSFLDAPENSLMGTLALVPQVVDAVKTPIIAAGGIADGRGIAAALALGAQGVQIGTAFLACNESAASLPHRNAVWNATTTALTRAFTGRLARGIENKLMRDFEKHGINLPQYPIQNWITAQLKSAAISAGKADLMSLWCGQSAHLLCEHNAEKLMQSLITETTAVIGKLMG